jgi:hypothetical protein
MKKIRLTGLMLGLLLGAGVMRAEAAPLTGGFSITGNFLPVLTSTGATTSLNLATALDFINFFGSAATPGVAGNVAVNSGSGSFAGLVGSSGTIKDFTFSGPGSALYPTVALLAFQQYSSGLTFDLTSVSVALQLANVLVLQGVGVFHMNGFQATNGTFTFSGNGVASTFSFSASNGATTAVPEPATLFALAMGLLVSGRFLRRALPHRA